MELDLWNRGPFMDASHLMMVSDVLRRAANALAVAPPSQIIQKYWNTICNNPRLPQKPPVVPVGSDSSDETSD